jgi:alpha-tubulin suppressor-like RCC1 family protein
LGLHNYYGQLGDGTTSSRSTPVAEVLVGAGKVAAGGNPTCALMTNGGVRCWGDNGAGQLADGTTSARSAPPERDTITGAQAVATGDAHTCVLLASGRVQCWGSAYAASTMYRTAPTPELEICQ